MGVRRWALGVRLVVAAALACLLPTGASAHTANIPAARAKVQVDGSVELRVRFDVLAFALESTPAEIGDGPMNELLDGPPAELQGKLNSALGRFRDGIRLMGASGAGAVDSIRFPTADDVHNYAEPLGKQRLPVMLTAVVVGHLPAGSKTASFQFPEMLGSVVLTTEFPYEEPVSEPVEPGAASRPLTIPTPAEVQQAASSMLGGPGAKEPAAVVPAVTTAPQPAEPRAERFDRIGSTVGSRLFLFPAQKSFAEAKPEIEKPAHALPTPVVVQPELPRNQSAPWYVTLPRYVRMGFVHIVPQGLDHILFVLGLFLLSTRTKDLLKQITAFTVAHSITLGLSLYGVFRLPSNIVEPVIAISIAFVAIENLFTTEMKAWRQYVVFAFGLVHGLGFASALQDAGLARAGFLTALVGFNAGVELGQLSVVLGAFALVGWFRSSRRYRPLVAIPASLAIAVVALVWTFERVF